MSNVYITRQILLPVNNFQNKNEVNLLTLICLPSTDIYLDNHVTFKMLILTPEFMKETRLSKVSCKILKNLEANVFV